MLLLFDKAVDSCEIMWACLGQSVSVFVGPREGLRRMLCEDFFWRLWYPDKGTKGQRKPVRLRNVKHQRYSNLPPRRPLPSMSAEASRSRPLERRNQGPGRQNSICTYLYYLYYIHICTHTQSHTMCRIKTNKTSPKYTLSKNTPLCRSEEIWTTNRFMSHEHFSVQVSFWFHNWLCLTSPCFCAQVARVVKKQVNQQTQEHWSTCRLSQHIIAISWCACKTVSMLSLTASIVASCCITYHSFTVINLNYIYISLMVQSG